MTPAELKNRMDVTATKLDGWWGMNRAQQIRLYTPPVGQHGEYCPITAICAAEKGRRFDLENFRSAAEVVGMESETSSHIADAADNVGLDNSRTRAYREAMCEARLGL